MEGAEGGVNTRPRLRLGAGFPFVPPPLFSLTDPDAIAFPAAEPPRLIALCYGTRPQVIKASVLRRALARIAPVHAVDTGQHYDFALNELLYQQLGVAPPDRFLEVGSASHAEQSALILTRGEAVLRELKPSATVVIGDTNSTLGIALAAAKLRIPVVHVEAGLRARDRMMAEEINRRAVDAMAALLCTPCRSATERMRREHPDARVVETGDVSYDVLKGALDRLPEIPAIVPGLSGRFVYATLHRAELTDHPTRLAGALTALGEVGLPVVFAVHPRTEAALGRLGAGRLIPDSVRMIPAVGYLESLALTRSASAVVTDSGGLQREAYWLGTPCVTLRAETEWEETVAAGANRLMDPVDAAEGLHAAVTEQIARLSAPTAWTPDAYGTGDAAEQVAQAVADLR